MTCPNDQCIQSQLILDLSLIILAKKIMKICCFFRDQWKSGVIIHTFGLKLVAYKMFLSAKAELQNFSCGLSPKEFLRTFLPTSKVD